MQIFSEKVRRIKQLLSSTNYMLSNCSNSTDKYYKEFLRGKIVAYEHALVTLGETLEETPKSKANIRINTKNKRKNGHATTIL